MKPMMIEQARYIGDLRDKSVVAVSVLREALQVLSKLRFYDADLRRAREVAVAIKRREAA